MTDRDVVPSQEAIKLRVQRDDAVARADSLSITLAQRTAQRDQWIRAFNKLDAAINHHVRDSPPEFRSDADERLHLAQTKVHLRLHDGTI
jgi:hypothetical protein